MANIERFLEAQENDYETALAEIKNGRKESHWIWYIFPQMKGLGVSYMSEYYGIIDLEEAREYMNNDILREHMIEICNALLSLDTDDVTAVMGCPDDYKLRSSMTLFSISNPEIDVFQKVLDKFCGSTIDNNTIALLERKYGK